MVTLINCFKANSNFTFRNMQLLSTRPIHKYNVLCLKLWVLRRLLAQICFFFIFSYKYICFIIVISHLLRFQYYLSADLIIKSHNRDKRSTRIDSCRRQKEFDILRKPSFLISNIIHRFIEQKLLCNVSLKWNVLWNYIPR